MKSKKAKKSIQVVQILTPHGTVDPQKSRRILAGANPWLDGP
jgi:hypothetical protein